MRDIFTGPTGRSKLPACCPDADSLLLLLDLTLFFPCCKITYMKYRENRHAETVDSTNKRVLFWNIAKIGTVIAIVIMQIFSIRGFFEKKRKI